MKKLIFLLILTVITCPAFCKTITVTSSADSGIGTLRQAVTDADVNDSIVFNDSITSITLSSVIRLKKNITIVGDSINTTTLLAPNSRHFCLLEGDSVVASLSNLTLKDGYYYTCGGSIYNITSNTLTLERCVFENNSSGSASGAIYNYGILNINQCLFKNNSSTGDAGVIYTRGKLFLYNSFFSKNQGVASGCIVNSNFALLANNIFIENTSTYNNGAVIYNYNTGSIQSFITIINTTIANNVGSGLHAEEGVHLYNSILFNNTENDIYVDASVEVSSANNIIGTCNIDLSGNENILNIDPLFVSNEDYSLQANSPAIDAGDNSFLADSILTDILGNSRVSGSSIDIGAYEYQKVSAFTNSSIQNKHKIYSFNRCIFIENNTDKVSIYSTIGQMISSGYGFSFSVANKGVYIVKISDTVQKVMVK